MTISIQIRTKTADGGTGIYYLRPEEVCQCVIDDPEGSGHLYYQTDRRKEEIIGIYRYSKHKFKNRSGYEVFFEGQIY